MKKTILPFSLAFLLLSNVILFQNAFAQSEEAKKDSLPVSPWTRSGSINASFTNVQLSNWAAGGQNSMSLGGIFNGKAIRETTKSKWINEITLQLGGARVGGSDRQFKKTDDFVIANSQYNQKINEKWAYTAGLDFRTQMLAGNVFFNDAQGQERRGMLISEFLSPSFTTVNIGASYISKVFTATFSPLTGRMTTVFNDSLSKAGAFGVAEGENFLFEFGPSFSAKLDLDIDKAKTVNIKSNLLLFSRYNDWLAKGLWDANWETLLTFKVNKYITTSFATHLIYYNNTLIVQSDGVPRQAVQFKQVLALNFGVKF